MNKKKLFIAAGTAVLGIVGFFAASAHNRKFVKNVTTAWFQTSGSTMVTLFHAAPTATHLTTVNGTTKTATAYFATVTTGGGETRHQLYATNGTTHKLYYKP
jgi:hypothetical protein